MNHRTPRAPDPLPEPDALESRAIDLKYGLEPVFEPGSPADTSGPAGAVHVQTVHCPYCGETFETQIDTSEGSARYVEDCQVCCQPIEFVVEVDHAGALLGLSTLRGD